MSRKQDIRRGGGFPWLRGCGDSGTDELGALAVVFAATVGECDVAAEHLELDRRDRSDVAGHHAVRNAVRVGQHGASLE
ncbi:hypothetical protein [Streptomyces rubiginosohelvolus]|uniref:hypothetical protein n=1 Tax=Streptomyces rubiginosohelvolus TaxID=67362 RepID=UPI0036C5CCC4